MTIIFVHNKTLFFKIAKSVIHLEILYLHAWLLAPELCLGVNPPLHGVSDDEHRNQDQDGDGDRDKDHQQQRNLLWVGLVASIGNN